MESLFILYKKIVIILSSLIILLGPLFQLAWGAFLGSEIPIVISINDLFYFLLFSLLLFLITIIYLNMISKCEKEEILLVVLILEPIILLFWFVFLIDFIQYNRNHLLVISRVIGFSLNTIIFLYSFYIWLKLKRKNNSVLG